MTGQADVERGVALALEAQRRGVLDERGLALVLAYYQHEGATAPLPPEDVLAGLGGVAPEALAGLLGAAPQGKPFNDRLVRLDLLGEGGMGAVYRAYDRVLRRPVALKLILAERLGSGDEQTHLARFEREAQSMARVRHPGCVAIYDAGFSPEGQPYLAMEFVSGTTLSARIVAAERAGRPLECREVARVGKAVAEALEACHEVGVIHRDVKPANILIDGDEQAKLTDFGIALDDDARTRLTGEVAAVGTLGYLPPEQAGGERADARSDVYALGATLYEALTGRIVFPGELAVMVLRKIIRDLPEPLRTLRKDVPRDLERIVLKCLEKEPGDRYASAQALALDLGRYLVGEPVEARPVGWLVRQARRAWKRRRVVASVLVSVALLSGVALWQWSELRESEAAGQRTSEDLARSEQGLARSEQARAKVRQASELLTRLQRVLRYQRFPLGTDAEERILVASAREETGEILGAFAALLATEPKPAQAYVLRGLGQHALLDLDAAEASARAAIAEDPELGSAHMLLGRVLAGRAALAPLLAVHDEAAEARQAQRTADAFRTAVTLGQPLDPLGLAWNAIAQGKLDEARRHLAAVPLHRINEEWEFASYVLEDQAGNVEDRDAHLEEALRINPRLPQALLYRGLLRGRSGLLDPAIEDLSRAILVKPEWWIAYLSRGALRYRKGEDEAGLEDCDAAVRLRPGEARSHMIRGRSRGRVGDTAGALEDFGLALTLFPADAKEVRALTHMARGDVLAGAGDFQAALEAYGDAVREEPGNAIAHRRRSQGFARLGDPKAALAEVDEAVRLAPKRAEYLIARVALKGVLKDLRGALADANALVTLEPSAEHYAVRGGVYAQLSYMLKAAADYEEALRLDPKGPKANEHRAFIQEHLGRPSKY